MKHFGVISLYISCISVAVYVATLTCHKASQGCDVDGQLGVAYSEHSKK